MKDPMKITHTNDGYSWPMEAPDCSMIIVISINPTTRDEVQCDNKLYEGQPTSLTSIQCRNLQALSPM